MDCSSLQDKICQIACPGMPYSRNYSINQYWALLSFCVLIYFMFHIYIYCSILILLGLYREWVKICRTELESSLFHRSTKLVPQVYKACSTGLQNSGENKGKNALSSEVSETNKIKTSTWYHKIMGYRKYYYYYYYYCCSSWGNQLKIKVLS